jgi:site-specific recombinase XerD
LDGLLDDARLRDLFAAFDRTTTTGRRDYAIAVCFTHLALRAGEVARISLDDIEWRSRVLTVAAGKARCADRLPIPTHLVAALADYVRHGRPKTNTRAIFVHHRAPVGAALGVSGVRGAMRQAYARAGFDHRLTGTHVLRHTAATNLLRAGASMKEIADVLRHRSLDTSAIYAKVDIPALCSVAVPWPEVRP